MANYYELLKIQPDASTAEIEQAIDAEYNQWRRLVTHHDPATAEKANRALRTLETMRATLTDPDKRAVYDAAVGVGGATGGLIDPSLLEQRPAAPPAMTPPAGMTPPPPRQAPAARPAGSPDAWICPKCNTENRPGTRFCKKCGNPLGINCPSCGTLVEASAAHCSECGVNIAEEQARLEMEARARKEQEEAAARAVAMPSPAQPAAKKGGCGRFVLVGVLLIGVMVCLVAASNLNLFGGSKAPKSAGRSISRATATPDPFAQGYIGQNIKMRAWLKDISSEGMRIGYAIANTGETNYTINLLSSDITLVDDLGNTYAHRNDTRPIQEELGVDNYSRGREFEESFNGFLPPTAKTLTVKFDQVGDERDIALSIPLASVSDQVLVDFKVDSYTDRWFAVTLYMTNNGAQPFAARFSAANVMAKDNLGNAYHLREGYLDDQYAFLLGTPSDYNNEEQIRWTFEPAVAPGASELIVGVTDLMGKPFQETVPLGVIQTASVRFEAKVDSIYDDKVYVDLMVFNLSQEPVIIRIDYRNSQLMVAGGSPLTATDNDEPIRVQVINPGESDRFDMTYTGTTANLFALTLKIPMISGMENLEVPVQSE